ncbi:MAG TPA: cytochrome c-type biogenesis protein [Steroidobacteraceae bacterium]|jgi:cytochrome c-type biogenesis protein CcmH|nr:cytochrome c-type biogenesis protein [Steroidobacteraceae bacterium]
MSRPASRFPVTPAMLVLVALGFMGSVVSHSAIQGVDANGQLEGRALQSRFERIARELRCLQCQNETIADSNAELAVDLRRQVREMLLDGKSDDAIFEFMTDRYGEFVRFSPPLEAKTLFIWGAPFVMLVVGGVIIYRVVRHRSSMPLDDGPAAGT